MNSGRWRCGEGGRTTSKEREKVVYVEGLYLIGSPMCRTIGLVGTHNDGDGRDGEEARAAGNGGGGMDMGMVGADGEAERGVDDIGVPGGIGVFAGSAIVG